MNPLKETISKRTLIFRYAALTVMTIGLAAIVTLVVWLSYAYIGYWHLRPGFDSDSLIWTGNYHNIFKIRQMGCVPVTDVDSTGNAFQVGMRVGDSIVAVNGRKLREEPQGYYRPFLSARAGDKVRYELVRDGVARQCTVTLVENFPRPIGYLGITHKLPSDTTGGWKRDTTLGLRIVEVGGGSPAEKAGLKVGDIIVRFNGERVTTQQEYGDLIDVTSPDQTVRIELVRITMPLVVEATLGERVEYGEMLWGYLIEGTVAKVVWREMIPWIMLYLVFLIVGGTIGWLRPRNTIAFLCSMLFLSIGPSLFMGARLMAVVPTAGLVAMFCYMEIVGDLGLPLILLVLGQFPIRTKLGQLLLRWTWIAYAYSALYAVYGCTSRLTLLYGWRETWILTNPVAQFLTRYSGWIYLPFILLMIALLVAQRHETRYKPHVRLKVIELGILLSIIGTIQMLMAGAAYDFLPESWQPSYYYVGLIIPILLFTALPFSFAYTILTRKIFDIRFIIRKGLRYLLLSKGALIVEGIIVFLIVIQILSYAGTEFLNSPTAVGGVAVASTLAVIAFVGRVNRKLMPVIDRRFFREVLDVKKLLMDLNEQLSELRERDKILQLTASTVLKALHPLRVVFLLKEGKNQEFKLILSVENEERKPQPSRHSELGSESEHSSTQMLKQVQHDAWGWFVMKAEDPIIKQLEEKKGWAIVYPEKLDLEKDEDKRLSIINCELLVAIRGSSGIVGVIALGGKLSEEPFSKEDRELLITVAREMGLSLENAELLEVAKREAEQSRDLEIARSVQQNLFPKQLPVVAGWEFAGICKPAKAVGGDYYDIFEPVPGKVVVALGDVSGKGLGASFLMSSVHGSIRTRVTSCINEPLKLIEELNAYLLSSTAKNIFVTLFFGIIDLETGKLTYVNCGHPPAIVIRQKGNQQERLTRNGPGLSMLARARFTQGECLLQTGDTVVIYSDGVTEAKNYQDEMYEGERLSELLNDVSGLETTEVMNKILKSVDGFASGAEQADDISVIVLKRC